MKLLNKNNLKNLLIIFFLLFSLRSYSQGLITNGKMITPDGGISSGLLLGSSNSFLSVPMENAFDSGADSLFTNISTTPTKARKLSMSNFYKRLKDSLGVTALNQFFDLLYIHSNYDTVSALTNWATNGRTFLAITYGGVAFSANNGFTGGANKWIDTKYNPSTQAIKFTNNANSFGAYVNNSVAGNDAIMGVFSTSQLWIGIYTTVGRCYGDNLTITTPFVIQTGNVGLFVNTRTASNVWKIYQNADSLGAWTGTPGTIPNYTFFICAGNSAIPPESPSNKQIGMSFVGRDLTGVQIRKINNCYLAWKVDIVAE